MHIEKIIDISLSDVILIAALPDMGGVGGLVTGYLKKTLDTKEAIKITLHDKPWVNQKNGIINYPKDKYSVFIDKDRKIAVFTGDGQPQEASTVMEMTRGVLDAVKDIGKIKMVISAGGYVPNGEEEGSVFGVATDDKTLKRLESHKISVLSGSVNSITWFNGLVLGQAAEMGVDGMGLFGKIDDSETPQYGAASNIVKKISEILDIEIDTAGLDSKTAKPPEKRKEDRPGIG